MTIKELDAKVANLKEILSTIDALTAEADAIKDAIKAEMIDRGSEVLTGTGWKASWKVIESSRIDTKAIKADLPDVAAKYTVTTRTSRFTLN